MTRKYSENNVIEQTAVDLFFHQFGWNTLRAFDKESHVEGRTLGLLDKKEVILKKNFSE